MSSRPEPPDLEGFIDDSFFFDHMPLGAREKLVAFYEPQRGQIECSMVEGYDPETMSWRDWRNNYWDYLPKPPKELLAMPLDEDMRELERAAKVEGGYFLARLAIAQLRVKRGLVWLWVARHGGYRIDLGPSGSGAGALRAPETRPTPPRNAVEVTVTGNFMGGDTLSSSAEPPPPMVRRGWISACLDLEQGLFGRRPEGGNDLEGPFLVKLETMQVAAVGGATSESQVSIALT